MAPANVTCYSQRDNDTGEEIVSQNFESDFDAYDTQAADDFALTVPCTVDEVAIDGLYFNGPGPAASLHVTLYADGGSHPGAVISDQDNLAYSDPSGLGAFDIALSPVALNAGTYWLSVQVNMDFLSGGEWGWDTNIQQRGRQAVWRNPGDGFGTGCSDWGPIGSCIPSVGTDFSFSVAGTPGQSQDGDVADPTFAGYQVDGGNTGSSASFTMFALPGCGDGETRGNFANLSGFDAAGNRTVAGGVFEYCMDGARHYVPAFINSDGDVFVINHPVSGLDVVTVKIMPDTSQGDPNGMKITMQDATQHWAVTDSYRYTKPATTQVGFDLMTTDELSLGGRTAGDPIPNVDVSLEQVPGGIVKKARTSTDGHNVIIDDQHAGITRAYLVDSTGQPVLAVSKAKKGKFGPYCRTGWPGCGAPRP